MPRLKDIECSIELANPQRKLQEHMITYGDGVVETFIAVPNESKPFAIHLTSSAYIAEGLAMYVFINGVYQCNRNRRGLENNRRGKQVSHRALVDFVVRQKEERQRNGEMVAREWRFEKLNTVSADQTPMKFSTDIVENIGCIEVVILRCKGSRGPPQNMGMDGANDIPDFFGLDGQVEDFSQSNRSLQGQQKSFPSKHRGSISGFTHVQPMEHTRLQPPSRRVSSNSFHPEYRSKPAAPYRKSGRQPPVTSQHYDPFQRGARVSIPTSRASHIELPPGSYHYGAGPIRRDDRIGSVIDEFKDRTSGQMKTENIIDPKYLKELTKNAYREGLKEARRQLEKDRNSNGKRQASAHDKLPQPPGAWPSTYDEIQISKENSRSESGQKPHSREPKNGYDWGAPGSPGSWKTTADQSGWHRSETRGDSPDSWQTSTWDTNNENTQYNSKAPHVERSNSVSWGVPPTVSIRNTATTSHVGKPGGCSGLNDKISCPTNELAPSSGDVSPHGSRIEHTSSWSGSHHSTLKPTKRPPTIPASLLHTQNIPPPPPYTYGLQESFQRSPQPEKTDPWSWGNSGSNRKMPGSWDSSYDWNCKQFDNDKGISKPTSGNSWDLKLPGHNQDQGNGAWDATSRSSSSWGSDKNDVQDQNRQKKSDWADQAKTNTADRKVPDIRWEKQNWVGWGEDTDAQAVSLGEQDWANEAGSSGKRHVESGGEEHNLKDDSGNGGWNNATVTWRHRGKQSTPSKSKGRLYSYRRLRDSGIKPYWQFPPSVPAKKLYPTIENLESSSNVGTAFILPKEPLNTTPFSVAEKKHIEHQARAGYGEKYTHAVNRPEYLDSLKGPYAVFRFKYSTRDRLKNMFPGVIPDDEPKVFVEELKSMSEEEKIAEILKLKEKLERNQAAYENRRVVGVGGTQRLPVTAPTHVKGWVQDQRQRSRRTSHGDASRLPPVQRSTQELQKGSTVADVGSHKTRPATARSKSGNGLKTSWGADGNDKGGTGCEGDDGWKGKDEGAWGDRTGGWDSGDTGAANVKW